MPKKQKEIGFVFWSSVFFTFIFVICGTVYSEEFSKKAFIIYEYMIHSLGWLYLFSFAFFILFCLFIGFSKYGNIRLGNDHDRPEYPFFTWIGMLFSAGFGVGLVFWGVAEPIKHFVTPPNSTVEGKTIEAIPLAIQYSMFHWGIHQWSVFTIVGLSLAYFQYRKKSSGLISSTLAPLIGTRYRHTIDTLAVIATVTGIATTLGLGVIQINGGLFYVFDIPINPQVQVIIIAVMLMMYLMSTLTGLDKGIKILSTFNLSLTLGIMLFILLLGPTAFIVKSFFGGVIDYVANSINMSFPDSVKQGYSIRQWTVFYWAWAIAWAPFVGGFIARVSKGRTIREFVIGVLFVPALVAVLWMTILGGSALHIEAFESLSISSVVQQDLSAALFVLLENFPFTYVISILTIILIVTFLVTSADSATFILGTMTTNGNLNPSMKVKLIWGFLQAAIAGVLLMSSGLMGLQSASLVAAVPFTIILIAMCLSLYKALRMEKG